MECPSCHKDIQENWQRFYAVTDKKGAALPEPADEVRSRIEQDINGSVSHRVAVRWMVCSNADCQRILVQLEEGYLLWNRSGGWGMGHETKEWLAVPRYAERPVDPLVPPEFARDYREAAAILSGSHRMSAVSSRRILADLLKKYAKREEFGLADRIDKFNEDTSHPSGLRDNLHHFREIANFGAHTQEDDQANIVDIDHDEAEWTLDLVNRLFDYFIVTPARDKEMRNKMDKKIDAAGRKPIKPPEDSSK